MNLDNIDYLRRMGEPEASIAYLTRTVHFDGEAVVVSAPAEERKPVYPNPQTGD
ncbi:hypothetical protein [Arenimonas alkanexedens]